MGFFGIGIFWDFLGFINFQIGIGFFWDWDFLGFFGFLNFQIGIGFFWVFWDWDFLGFFVFFLGLDFLDLKLVLVFFCFLTIIYGNIHNRVLASAQNIDYILYAANRETLICYILHSAEARQGMQP